jgi:hypothetical protein
MEQFFVNRRNVRAVITLYPSGPEAALHTVTEWDKLDRMNSLLACLKRGLPLLEEEFGISSIEATHTRELIAAIETKS